MTRYINRKILYFASFMLSLLLLGYGLTLLSELRERIVGEYFRHKEFLFNLRSVPKAGKRSASEEDINTILKELNLEAKRIFKTETGVEVELSEVYWEKVPYMIKEFEKRFEFVSFSAVDNTGKGLFEVRIVLK